LFIPPFATLIPFFEDRSYASKENFNAKNQKKFRLRLETRLLIRQISASIKISVGTTQKLLSRVDALEITWPLPEDLDDGRLARCVTCQPPQSIRHVLNLAPPYQAV